MNITEARRRKALNTAIKWLVQLQSPELSRARQIEFFDWLASSPVHQSAYLEAEQLWERGEALNYAARLEGRPEQRFFSGWWAVVYAGVCVMALGCIVLLKEYNPMATARDYRTILGEQKKIVLADGSRLVLNTNTHIRVRLDRGKRVVYLNKGEVFFDIQPLGGRPFDVMVPNGIVRVLGTQFSIYNSGGDSLITVMEGKVGLAANKKEGNKKRRPENNDTDDNIHLDATLIDNQRLTLAAAATGKRPQPVDAAAALAWRNGQLIYRGDSLGEVIRDLNRYFDARIRLADRSMSETKVIAVIQISEIEVTLAALAESLDLSVVPREEINEFILQPNGT